MNLPFEKTATATRSGRSGFTLIEVMIAFAIVALVLTTVAVTLSGAATQQTNRLRELWLSEFARSVLDEYAETGPGMPPSGQAKGGWYWEVGEKAASPNPPGPLDQDLGYVAVTARVWNVAAPDQVFEVSTLLARRLQ